MTKEQTRLKLLSERERKLYLEDIPVTLTQADFENYFSQYGQLESVRVIHEKRKNGTQKNFSFILFKSNQGLESSIKETTLHKIRGHIIDCKPTKLREELKQIQQEKQNKKSKKGKKKTTSKKSNDEKLIIHQKNKLDKIPIPKITVTQSPPQKLENPIREHPSKTSVKKENSNFLEIPFLDPNNNFENRELPSETNLSEELSRGRLTFKNKSAENTKTKGKEQEKESYFHLRNVSSLSEESKEFSKNSQRDRSDTILTKQFLETALKGYGHYRMIPFETYSQTSMKSRNDSNLSNNFSIKSTPLNKVYSPIGRDNVVLPGNEGLDNAALFQIMEEEKDKLENASTKPNFDDENQTVITFRDSIQPKISNMSIKDTVKGKKFNIISRLKGSNTANSSELLGFNVSKKKKSREHFVYQGEKKSKFNNF